MLLTIIESPLAATTDESLLNNILYARQCIYDSLKRGEAPFASHLLYTQVLDDAKPEHRSLGMLAGWYWMKKADQVVVYTDRGISSGMREGIKQAEELSLPIRFRSIEKAPDR
jgi:hypothetical protein